MDNPFVKRPKPDPGIKPLMPLKMAMAVLSDVASMRMGERISVSGIEAVWIVGKALEFALAALTDAQNHPCLHLVENAGLPCGGHPQDDLGDPPRPYDAELWCPACICKAALKRLNEAEKRT